MRSLNLTETYVVLNQTSHSSVTVIVLRIFHLCALEHETASQLENVYIAMLKRKIDYNIIMKGSQVLFVCECNHSIQAKLPAKCLLI